MQRLAAYGEPVDGTPFGRYRLIELLGRGGMGEVWRAHDTATDRVVAIKVLPAHFSDNEEFQRRFRREAHAAARLNTPHVVPIHNYGEIDGRLYVDMRLIEGRDLDSVLVDGPLEPARAVRIIEGVALALHAAHEVGLVHRDVKPSNILLDRNDFAYLIDFGIARAADETRLTSTGNAIGTFQYMAPERLGDHPSDDARADIYALACVLYECLTGQPPFAGASMGSLVAAHLHTAPPQPSTSQPNVPKQVDQVIATGMAKDPDQRYATTIELADAAHNAITTPLAPPSKPTLLDDQTRPAARQHSAELTQPATQQRPPGRAPGPQPRPANQQPPEIGTPPPASGHRQRLRLKWPLIAAIVVIVAAAAGITGYQLYVRAHHRAAGLPFTPGLHTPGGVALDTAGDVYVADTGNNRVVKLAAGSSTQTVLPFTGLQNPDGVAVDTAGDVYVADMQSDKVLMLAAGSSTQTVLPFTGLTGPTSVAVDTAGDVYVTEIGNAKVLMLASGSSTQTVLPFTDLNYPWGVAVDTARDVYVADSGNNRVVKLAAGSSTQTVLSFLDLKLPWGVAVDTAGGLYVADLGNNRVVKLAAGSSTQTVLPFTELNKPTSVAVDTAGDVYVADSNPTNNRVVKLAAG